MKNLTVLDKSNPTRLVWEAPFKTNDEVVAAILNFSARDENFSCRLEEIFVSSCCQANLVIVSGRGLETTNSYKCLKCDKPCDGI